jgi:hypothetical protein
MTCQPHRETKIVAGGERADRRGISPPYSAIPMGCGAARRDGKRLIQGQDVVLPEYSPPKVFKIEQFFRPG